MEMDGGTVNCLHCSHSNISLDKMKCHTFSQHPTQSAVALNIHGSERDIIIFFCVRETCEYSTTFCNDYEKHLIGCLNINEIDLPDVLKERLHSSISFVLDFHSRHGLEAALEFKDFVSSVFDFYESVDSHVTSPSHLMKGTHLDTHVSNTCASAPQNLKGIKLEDDNGCYDQIVVLKKENEGDEAVDMNGPPHFTFTATVKKENTATVKTENTANSFIDHLVSENPKLENDIASELSYDMVSDFFSSEAINDNVKTEEIKHSETDTLDQNSTTPPQYEILKRLDTSLNITKVRSEQKEDSSMTKPKLSDTNCPGSVKSKPSMAECTQSVKQTYMYPIDFNIEQKNSVCWECFRLSVFCLDVRNDTLCLSKGDDHIEVHTHHERKLTIQSGGISFKSKECKKILGQDSHFHNHMKIHEGFKLNRFKCIKCSKTSELKSGRCGKPFQCKECGQSFKYKINLNDHLRIHTSEKPFQCKGCGQAFRYKSRLNRHMRIHIGENLFQCKECGQVFTQKYHLICHMRIHTGEKPFNCKECEQAFNHKSNLVRHMRIHTGEKSFHCKECGMEFRLNPDLIEHMRIHADGKPFQCKECGHSFGHKCNLDRHMKIHTGEKPFYCKECGQTFHRKSYVKEHMRIHTGEKPFKCNECGQTFNRKTHVSEHMKIHTGEKPFNCKECGQSFNRKGNLNEHMKIHTGERLFQCEECGRTFQWKTSLKKHMRKHTDEKPMKL